MRASDFDYELPEDRIAQEPLPRGTARLLLVDRNREGLSHHRVSELPRLLAPGDLVLLNDTRVLPARLHARRPSGRRFELLLLEQLDRDHWKSLLRPSSRARAGERLELSDGGLARPQENLGEGSWRVRFEPPLDLDRLETLGEAPLPPYIRRPGGATPADREAYQTVFARRPGAVAAPTAGLHLTQRMLAAMEERGIELARLTLHVGIGTFRPVSVERVEDHRMHAERYEVSPEAAEAVNRALATGRRIVCIGTTTVRALESALAAGDGAVRPGSGRSELFIRPGFRFRGTGALMTNFHLPRSTLLMLVSALAGRERILAAYAEALEAGYRFYSYGDAMLIL